MAIYQNRNGTAFIKNDEIIETKKKKRKKTKTITKHTKIKS